MRWEAEETITTVRSEAIVPRRMYTLHTEVIVVVDAHYVIGL